MNRWKVKEFVKEHKAEFIAGAGIVLSGVLFAIAKNSGCSLKTESVSAAANGIRNISVPEGFAVGEVTDLWEERGCINAIVNGINTNDLGKLGGEFVRHGLTADGAEASVVVGFLKK